MKLPAALVDPNAPKTFWEKIVGATPVILTVIATVLAGISSSEMTRAQYERSLAAQNQGKASDQWGQFQAHRMRNFEANNTLRLLQSLGGGIPADAAELRDEAARVVKDLDRLEQAGGTTRPAEGSGSDSGKWAGNWAVKGRAMTDQFTGALEQTLIEEALKEPASGGGSKSTPAAEPDDTAAPADGTLFAEIAAAEKRADDVEQATKPTLTALNKLVGNASGLAGLARACGRDESAHLAGAGVALILGDLRADTETLDRDATAAQLHYTAGRYVYEAGYNQVTAKLYDAQVQRDGDSAERHQRRSKLFFYVMLLAQTGVTISTLALAIRQRSLLWGLATLAGATALTMGSYVYLRV